MPTVDILAFAAHPDDAELSCAGTLLVHRKKGYSCGIIDLTRGELGTRGNAETRSKEAESASDILGLTVRENLLLEDGFISNNKEDKLKIAAIIRKYRPKIILCNAISDRHPDHGRSSSLVSDAVFLAGLKKVILNDDKKELEHWKTSAVYHYIQDRYIEPDVVVDITDFWEDKMKAVLAYSSQFYNPSSTEPETSISTKEFLDFLKARAIEFGRQAGFKYAEGFTVERVVGVKNLFEVF
jgi:N-acetylglucosamine malate deacetylase 1